MTNNNKASSYNKIVALKSTLATKIKHYGEVDSRVADCVQSIADELNKQKNYQEAISYYRHALNIYENEYEAKQEDIAKILTNLADSLHHLKIYSEAESSYRRALKLWEKIYGPDNALLAIVFNDLANLLYHSSNYSEAEQFYQQAIKVNEKLYGLDSKNVARTVGNLAILLNEIGRYPESEIYYRRKLEIDEKTYGIWHSVVATTLRNLADTLIKQDKYGEAEQVCHRSLVIREKTYGTRHSEVADILNVMGSLQNSIGNYDKAEQYFNRALEVWEYVRGTYHPDVGSVLNNLAIILHANGKYSTAESYYRRALNIFEKAYGYEHEYVASALVNLASLHDDLGNYSEAKQFCLRALMLREKIYGVKHPLVARILNVYGNLLVSCGEYNEAEQSYRRALGLYENYSGSEHSDIAKVITNLANALSFTGKFSEAEPLQRRALEISTNLFGTKHPDLASIQINLANTLRRLDKYSEAGFYCRCAQGILEQVYEKESQFVATGLIGYSLLMRDEGQLYAAIILGKRAINILQKIRSDVTQIDKKTLDSFDQTIEKHYHSVAEMLIKTDRIIEAEYVIGLLKEDEYFDFVRRDAVNSGIISNGVPYNQDEVHFNNKYDVFSQTLSSLSFRINSLKQNRARTNDEENEYSKLKNRLETASREFNEFLDELHVSLGNDLAQHVDTATDMMSTLWDLDKEAAVIYTLSTKDNFYTILVTPCAPRKKFIFPISSEDLSRKVLRFRELIMKRDIHDVEPLACELYDIIMGKMADELKDAGITTLMWMLEGPLRLLPVSALHDGTNYIVNKYRNVYLTTKSRENLHSQSKPNWTALGMGVTQAHEHFKALPAVKEELEGIVIHDGSTQGVHPGEILLDGDFTWDAMTNELDGDYQAVHIASHFNLDPCNETMSYLLLGDGTHLTLDKLKNQSAIFRGVDLLAFSACSTGLGTASKLGREIDGIGYIAENQGAKTVLATLWPVADESTSLLMRDFYKRRAAGATKIEALRQAQLGMLNGTLKPTKPPTERSGEEPLRFEVDSEKPYAHPYYWAPFILIGNYR